MSFIIDFFTQAGGFFAQWLHLISTALIASTIIAFSNSINQFVFRILNAKSFIFRTLLFILICGFGYGLLIVVSSPVLANLLAQLPHIWLFFIVIAAFILVGVIAQKNSKI